MKKVVTKEHIEFAKKNYLILTASDIDRKFNVSKGVTSRIYKKFNISVNKEVTNRLRAEKQRKPITQEEIKYIHENIKTKSIKKISRELKRVNSLISKTAHELGYSDLIEQKTINSRYLKGHAPANKGQIMSKEAYEKCKATMFKKGSTPPNAKYFGKPFLYSRIRKDNGRLESVWLIVINTIRRSYLKYLCEINGINTDGKVARLNKVLPQGQVPTIEDIEVITYKENMEKNSIHRFPEDLKTNIRRLSILKKRIKKLEQ